MQKIHMSILIGAPREKVWEVMLGQDTYPQWTAEFQPGSHYVGEWAEGSKIQFLGPDPETGQEMGMVSMIEASRPPEFVSIKHLGIVKNGVEDTESDEAKKWAPAYENYTFTEKDGGTELTIDQDIEEEHKAMFEELWGKALLKLKALAEA